jgi:hypothetical protein
MNKRTRDKHYKIIANRDGERCKICGWKGDSKNLVIDHIDNNNSNNELSNLQLLCRSDNNRKNPRGKGKLLSPMYVCVSSREFEEVKRASPEMEKNTEAEPTFRHWIFEELRERITLPIDEVIDSGAEVSHCSQETIKRYLRKICSPVGFAYLRPDGGGKKWILLKVQEKKEELQNEQD